MSNGDTSSGRSSRDIEREAEANRAQLSETLEELRERLSPGQLLDELLSGSRTNVAGFVENLGASIRDNPMPTVLIGAGLAMMAMGGAQAASRGLSDDEWERRGRPSHGGYSREDEERFGRGHEDEDSLTSRVGDAASQAGDYASDMARSARDTASGLVSSASDTASSAVRSVRDSVGSVAETVREYIPGMGSSSSSSSSRSGSRGYVAGGRGGYRASSGYGGGLIDDMRNNLTRLAHEQPLMVAAVGLAIGAGIGAALPRTRVENRWVGDTADQLKDAATEAAAQGYERAKDVVSRTAHDIQEEARQQGLTPDRLADTARHAAEDMTDRVKAVAEKARTSVTDGAREVAQSAGLTGEAGPAGKPSDRKPGESKPGDSKPAEARPATPLPGGSPGVPGAGTRRV
ncbi:DUF3618 domain-containing protein [Alsobacter sp. SYSU M60028]|uniref:DUF3618 domain-containing protein n=1 Tax=Alsobacter ponti TaxID=2962936 RepID=A0ABT1LDB0_9HYPH|nr:DUF3618 domain-containing protein [Alsobacter ponti]MCP8939487.1 DUF3618 domain-containing protein [Alsobacter ponti]